MGVRRILERAGGVVVYKYQGSQKYDLIVIHTNEGPEGPRSAEDLAAYLNSLHARDSPGYHKVGDENSSVMMASDGERVNGAGGVNARAWHYCITGYAGQDASQWNDPASLAAIRLAALEAHSACGRLTVPVTRILNPTNQRGVCGHGDVSRYYDASMGHTDPGTAFPWDKFMRLMGGEIIPDSKLQSQEDEVYRVIHGDAKGAAGDQFWLTNWLEKRKITSGDESTAIIQAGVTNGAGPVKWPQAWVDAIPVKTSDK